MKRRGILNPALAFGLARLGHTQTVVIADCGLPLPPDAHVVDLALVQGIPAFTDVLDAVLDEIVIEGVVLASEAVGTVVESWVNARIGDVPVTDVPHQRFKELLMNASLIVRTGEATPYANVALSCSVPF